VKQQVIACQDVDPSGFRLLVPFDYTLTDDEKAKYAGKLLDKHIVIGVRELLPLPMAMQWIAGTSAGTFSISFRVSIFGQSRLARDS
jgi:hypothetical protein